MIVWVIVLCKQSHTIRTEKTACFKSVLALESTFRWCMTGIHIIVTYYMLLNFILLKKYQYVPSLYLYQIDLTI